MNRRASPGGVTAPPWGQTNICSEKETLGSPYPGALGSLYPGALGSPYPGALGSPYPGALGSPTIEISWYLGLE